MVLQIAWRNIWRSKIRSFVVMGAIIIGIWSILFIVAFTSSMVGGYIKNAIQNETSHIQLHHPDFVEDQDIQFLIEQPDAKLANIQANEAVKAATLRTNINGMLNSARGARGVNIRGVIPDQEAAVTNLPSKIIEGSYFRAGKKNEILISQILIEKLKLKLRKKVVLQFQDLNGNITSGAFRIVGIFKTGNTLFDESKVMVHRKDLNRLMGQENSAHEIAVYLKDTETLLHSEAQLKKAFPALLVENYRVLSPDVLLYESQIDISATIFTFIFMLALIFGIINTMLMAVLERNKELGMLMAVGMNKGKIFLMIVLETLFLGLVATPIGLFLGWLTINYFGKVGIDLTAFAAGIEKFGMATIIYPNLTSPYYISLAISVFITALLAALYPALKAIQLKPIEAIHKI